MEFRAKKILCFSGLLLLFWLCARFLLPFFLPFLLGTGLALASEPAVRFLCRQGKLPRALAAGVGVSAMLFDHGDGGFFLFRFDNKDFEDYASRLQEQECAVPVWMSVS